MKDGIFSFLDFTKPGIDRPEPSKPFIRFWYRYAMRFFHLIRLNLIFFAVSLPFYVSVATLYNAFVVGKGFKNIALLAALVQYALQSIPGAVKGALVVLSVVAWGSANAGLQYVAGRYAQGEHAWPWYDFFAAAKANWKQGLLFGLIDATVVFLSLYYLTSAESFFGAFIGVARSMWILLTVLYGLGRCYLYPIMVQIDLPAGQLFKNSVLLSLVKPLRTLLILIAVIGVVLLSTVADMVILPLFAYSFLAFTVGAVSAPMIRKHLVDPALDATSNKKNMKE